MGLLRVIESLKFLFGSEWALLLELEAGLLVVGFEEWLDLCGGIKIGFGVLLGKAFVLRFAIFLNIRFIDLY